MEQKINKFSSEKVPALLKGFHNWVVWTPKKVPLDPKSLKPASITDSKTWGTYDEAAKAYLSCKDGSLAGIGFVFTHSPFMGIDLDKCRDPKTGRVDAWAMDIVNAFKSYSEISPSGTGLHIIVMGKLPEGSTRRRNDEIEIYDTERYFTITGNLLPGSHPEIKDRQDMLINFYHQHFPEVQVQPKQDIVEQNPLALSSPQNESEEFFGQSGNSPPVMSDEDVIKKALHAQNGDKFKRLFSDGDWSNYLSRSEADHALAGLLDFWTQDPEQKERILRKSALYREKWDKNKTYLDRTIKSAISTEHYQPAVESTLDRKNQPEESDQENPQETKGKTNWGKQLRLWIMELYGESYTLDQFYREFGINDPYVKTLIRNNHAYLLKTDFVERVGHGTYKQIDNELETIDVTSASAPPLDLKLPFDLEKYIKIYPGSIIVQAGETNAGKTGISINFAYLNRDSEMGPVLFLCSEHAEQLKDRLSKSRTLNSVEVLKIQFKTRYDNFHHVIKPDGITVVDWLEAPGDGDYFKLESELTKIQKKLGKGVCWVNLQKDPGSVSDYGHGGPKTATRSQLYLTLRNNPDYSGHSIKIVKAKAWVDPAKNPNGLVRQYKLHSGIDIELLSDWHMGGEEIPLEDLFTPSRNKKWKHRTRRERGA